MSLSRRYSQLTLRVACGVAFCYVDEVNPVVKSCLDDLFDCTEDISMYGQKEGKAGRTRVTVDRAANSEPSTN